MCIQTHTHIPTFLHIVHLIRGPTTHTFENSYYPLDLFLSMVLQSHSMKGISLKKKHDLNERTLSNIFKIKLLFSPMGRCLEASHLFHLHIEPVLNFLNP